MLTRMRRLVAEAQRRVAHGGVAHLPHHAIPGEGVAACVEATVVVEDHVHAPSISKQKRVLAVERRRGIGGDQAVRASPIVSDG